MEYLLLVFLLGTLTPVQTAANSRLWQSVVSHLLHPRQAIHSQIWTVSIKSIVISIGPINKCASALKFQFYA